MKDKVRSAKMLLYQGAGFLVLIAVSWINESLNLHTLILGDHPYISDFRESTLEMLFVLAVWLLVYGSTRRLMAEKRELESFMKVCSWCRRIGADKKWMAMEEFFSSKFSTPTSHGICEDCFQKQEEAIEATQRQLHLPTLDPGPLKPGTSNS
jgi:hypothetical protein